MAANAASCSSESPDDEWRRKRRERSRRDTWLRPHDWQMETALAEKAVEKFMRGPTSTTWAVAAVASWLVVVSLSGSNVSRSSLCTRAVIRPRSQADYVTCAESRPVAKERTTPRRWRRLRSGTRPGWR